MQQRQTIWLVLTALLVIAAVYIVLPNQGLNFTLGATEVNEPLDIRQGLDLQGGLQVLLEADVPAEASLSDRDMAQAMAIVESRVNALGLTEPLVQRQGSRRIVVELPGIRDPQVAIDTIKQTALLEFVDVGANAPADETLIQTDCADPSKVDCGASSTATGATTPAPAASATTAATLEATALATGGTAAPQATAVPGPAYHTVMTGAGLKDATVLYDRNTNRWVIQFTLKDDGARIFGDYTSGHIGEPLAIVLDKRLISAPTIENAITQGEGTISGRFTQESANQLALQLRSGALPVPLKVVTSREVGPTLGQDSVRKSVVAGVIGVAVVALFMALYYRLPGLIAVVALAIYAVLTFALFILLGVTLTLPGIAGFVLSVGVAVDANVLIFERMKEELRAGRALRQAVEAGFSRAWPSIRDSNISTLITCAILFWFGNTFGASIVKGFALTLALGVGVSLFTAILVTRTILHTFLDRLEFSTRHSWFGI